jgi:hypothetical protein
MLSFPCIVIVVESPVAVKDLDSEGCILTPELSSWSLERGETRPQGGISHAALHGRYVSSETLPPDVVIAIQLRARRSQERDPVAFGQGESVRLHLSAFVGVSGRRTDRASTLCRERTSAVPPGAESSQEWSHTVEIVAKGEAFHDSRSGSPEEHSWNRRQRPRDR